MKTKSNSNLKQLLLQKCQKRIEEQIAAVQGHIKDIQESLASETKSSAGDKHETGRAMIQLEREKAGKRLAEIEKEHAILSKIDARNSAQIIGFGSLVFTDKGNYFIAVSAGEVEVDELKFYAVSSGSPIGKTLTGKTKTDRVKFRDQEITINSVH